MGNKFARVMFSYYDAWKNGFTSDLKHKKCDFLHKNDLKHKKNSPHKNEIFMEKETAYLFMADEISGLNGE